MPSYIRLESTEPAQEFCFARVPASWPMLLGLSVLGLAFFVGLCLGRHTTLVRDPQGVPRPDGLPPYSLGRCQMAFWFFLVAGAFFFLWLVTGRGDLDTLNGSTLALIGISAGTALGAAVINGRNLPPAPAAAVPPAPEIPYPERIRAARSRLAAIDLAQHEAHHEDAAPAGALAAEREAAELNLRSQEEQFRRYRATRPNEFLYDLLEEDGVVSFHRFQIVVWTLVLGIVFAAGVISKLAMPKFDATLLLLMGVSSGTYLSFKMPERRA